MLKKLILNRNIVSVLKIKNISSIRVENFTPLWGEAPVLHTLKPRFTGIKNRVNHPAGKSLGGSCLFSSQVSPYENKGDAKSRAGLGNPIFQGPFRGSSSHLLYQEHAMHSSISLREISQGLLSKVFLTSLFVSVLILPSGLMAHDGDLLKDEITALEKLFTGGYMRLGLLGVCGFAAIYGIVKQSGWIFASGILGCMFAYFMKDWITKTFTLIA